MPSEAVAKEGRPSCSGLKKESPAAEVGEPGARGGSRVAKSQQAKMAMALLTCSPTSRPAAGAANKFHTVLLALRIRRPALQAVRLAYARG